MTSAISASEGKADEIIEIICESYLDNHLQCIIHKYSTERLRNFINTECQFARLRVATGFRITVA